MKKNLLCIAMLLFAAAIAAHAAADSTPPVLVSLSFAPGAVDVSSSSQAVAMNVQATDNASGVQSISATFRSPSGKQFAYFYMGTTDLASGNPLNGVFSSTAVFSSCNEAGTWTLYSVTLTDQCENSVTYASSASGSVLAFPAGTPTTIAVTNTNTITSTPQLVSFSFAPSGVDLTSSNHTVTVTAELSDSTAGIQDASFTFENSTSGGQTEGGYFDSSNMISGNAYDGVYQTVVTFGTCDPPGNWNLVSVDVEDPCSNTTQYGTNGAAFPNGTQTLITVTNPNADITPPALSTFWLSSTEADVTSGEVEITGSAAASDNASGVASGELNYSNNKNSLSFFFDASGILGGTILNGTFGGTMTVGPCAQPGVYTLKNILVFDNCGNEKVYGGSGNASLPSGVPVSILVVNGTLATGSVSVNIYPQTAEFDGYTWNVDGGNSEFSGATVTGVAAGSHMVNFLPLSGFTTPAAQNITVAGGLTTFASGTYASLMPSDAIQVNILPSGVGGMWTVDNGPLQVSGATVNGLYDGPHTIQFSNVSGYTAPAGQVITTASNLTSTTTGTYSQITQFGAINCTITPSGAIHNGAMWNVDGGASQSSGSTVSGIAVGPHSVNFTSATGYTTAQSQTVQVNNNATTSTTGTYTPSVSSTGSLTVTILPSAAVKAGAEWNVDGGASQKSGATVNGLSGGNHTVNFTMINGYITPASQLVSITPNGNVTTTGTYTTAPGFSGAAQSFIGLSASGNALVTMSMMSNGKFTGKFEVDGEPALALSGSLSVSGSFSGTAGKKPGVPFTVQVTGTSPSTYMLTGSAEGVQITAYPYAYAKQQTVAEVGKYNSLLVATTIGSPDGTGYGTITVSKTGVASIAGKLADGTGFTASNPLVAGAGGNAFIIYDPSLYAKKGILSGMLTFVSGSGSASGTLNWIKPATMTAYYAAGFNANLLAQSQIYTSGTIPFTSGTISFLGGPLSTPIIEPFSVTGSKITITGTSNPADVTLKFTPATGAISGTLLVPGGNKPVKYSGLLLKTPVSPRAGGFFLGPVVSGSGQSGAVLLPQPPI